FNRDIVRINFDGKFDANGKDYLVDLYQKGYSVIPSISNIEEFSKLPEVDNYLLKPKNSYDGYGQRRGSKEYILSQFTPNDIIQPMISFQSEVEFYFVGNELQYAFEYVPNKLVERYEVKEYHYSSEEHFLAQTFADLNPDFNGVQRIDFLKQKDGTLLLLEIEDCAPYLNLEMLSEEKREQFIANYKDMVYQCVKKYTKRR
ncbi:MAG: hypothetical protein KH135_03165, partial [Firmicutes bacterium]|nr:hypothetical protein [Bacillota bacterium]